MLQQGQRTLRLTAQRPRWTLQDQCHHILRTFTLFKDKCIVNFVSPSTRYACRFTPPAAKGGLTSTRCKTLYKWNQMSFSMVQNYLNLQSTAVLLDFRLKCRGLWGRRTIAVWSMSIFWVISECRVHVLIRHQGITFGHTKKKSTSSVYFRFSTNITCWHAHICRQLFAGRRIRDQTDINLMEMLYLLQRYMHNICKYSASTSVEGVTYYRLKISDLSRAEMWVFASTWHMHHSVHPSTETILQRLWYRSALQPK